MNQPLADRVRPHGFDDMVGQENLVGPGGILRRMVDSGHLTNMIFFGPPGTGKTTAANIIAERSGMTLRRLNATTAGIADVKAIIDETGTLLGSSGILLYLDEIQYFNKKQQQSLLEYIEDGRITLIASTTENPYFYVYNAIISRSAVFEFKPVSPDETKRAITRALDKLNHDGCAPCEEPGPEAVKLDVRALELLASRGAGDVRRSLGLLENAYYLAGTGGTITTDIVDGLTPKVLGSFDKAGDVHYDLLSCLQKSIRGSDPDAAVFYLAKLLEGGDILSACRRLQVIASEDIGLADSRALETAVAAYQACHFLGMPECTVHLTQAVVYMAMAPKSNALYVAYETAKKDAQEQIAEPVPLQIRNAETSLMKNLGYGKGYVYAHDTQEKLSAMTCLPDSLQGKRYYQPTEQGNEGRYKQRLEEIIRWKEEHRGK